MPVIEEGLLNKSNGIRKVDHCHLLIYSTAKLNILMLEINILNQYTGKKLQTIGGRKTA